MHSAKYLLMPRRNIPEIGVPHVTGLPLMMMKPLQPLPFQNIGSKPYLFPSWVNTGRATSPMLSIDGLEREQRCNFSSKARLERSRDRNRVHARLTRLRKKERLDKLQDRVKQLHETGLALREKIEQRKTASILLMITGAKDTVEIPECPEIPNFEEIISDNELKISDDNQKQLQSDTKRQRTCAFSHVPDARRISIEVEKFDDESSDESVKSKERFGEYFLSVNSEAGATSPSGQQYSSDDTVTLNTERTKKSRKRLDRREQNRINARRTRLRKKELMEKMLRRVSKLEEKNNELLGFLKQHKITIPENLAF